MLQLPYIDALLIHKSQSFPAKVLIYSRSSGNFISSHFLFQIHLPRQKNATHYQITTIQEKTLGKGLVHYRTPDVVLQIECLHNKQIFFPAAKGVNGGYRPGMPMAPSTSARDQLELWRNTQVE